MVAFLVEHDDVTYQSVLFIQNRFPIETFKCKRCSLSAITPAVDAFLQTGRKPLVLSLDYILLYKRGMCHRGRIIRDRAIVNNSCSMQSPTMKMNWKSIIKNCFASTTLRELHLLPDVTSVMTHLLDTH